jgi:prophage maintenance system killer protein
LRLPSVDLAIAVNEAVRQADEWFDEPEDLDRLATALRSADDIEDPVLAAARLAFRVAASQAFGEGNKRTALLLARWVLDHNGADGARILPVDDEALGDLLVKAASGVDVEGAITGLLRSRT